MTISLAATSPLSERFRHPRDRPQRGGHHRPTSGTVSTATSALSRAGSDATFAGSTIGDHLAVAKQSRISLRRLQSDS